MKPHLKVLGFLFLVAVSSAGRVQKLEQAKLSRSHQQEESRAKVLFRIHRQAEDSYEDGGEYEYEEEESPGESPPEEAESDTEIEAQPTNKEQENEEYYDGENYDERNEKDDDRPRTTPLPTTTTTVHTTTPEPEPEPTHASMEQIEDEDHYEERYEEERRRYEQETLRQQYEQTHGSDNESPEESHEGRTRERDETLEESEKGEDSNMDVEDSQESPTVEKIQTTTTQPSHSESVDFNQPEPTIESKLPETSVEESSDEIEKKSEIDNLEDVKESDIDKNETETIEIDQGKIPVKEDNEEEDDDVGENPDETLTEIEESGRNDLERYSFKTPENPESENIPEHHEEEDEYNEIDEEEHVREPEPSESPSTTTTTTTTEPPTTVEPNQSFGEGRDPNEYEVEQPANNEDEEYYEKSEESPIAPTTSTTTPTTTTTKIPDSSIENEVSSVEDHDYNQGQRKEVVVEQEKFEEVDHETLPLEPEEKFETEEEYVEEPSTTSTTTTSSTTTTTMAPTTTSTLPPTTSSSPPTTAETVTFLPYDPEPDEYEETEEEDDEYGIYSRTTSTTSPSRTTEYTTTTTTSTTSTTTRPLPVIPPFEVDSRENEIYEVEKEDFGESGEEIQIDHARNQYEISPIETPEERPIIEEITPKIDCFTGYKLSEDGQECLDVNECQSSVCGPLQICQNLPGSYLCSCNTGYIKDIRNERNCRDVNECEISNGGCDQDCINTAGSFYCACADDFDVEGKKCVRKITTTTTTSTTTTTTTTPVPPTTPVSIPKSPFLPRVTDDGVVRNCPTPPVPRGTGIAYLYCSRSPVGIHHRHSQLERRLLQDWAARKNKTHPGGRNTLKYRNRRNLLKRKLRQTTYSPGSMCELRCRPGFELKGQYTLHCNASDGTWQGTRNGFCHALPKTDNQNVPVGLSNSETTPSNEIPRLAPNEVTGYNQFRPSFVSLPPTVPSISFRPTYHQPPPPAPTRPTRPIPSSPSTTISTTTTTSTTTPVPITTSTFKPHWVKPSAAQIPSRRPYYFSPSTPYSRNAVTTPIYLPVSNPITTVTPLIPSTTTSRNSYIHLTYRFKTPWIKCPDDIKLDLPTNQNTAYVIIPQPQTNVDWWRQVTAEPSWAKGLETESGPGKQRITFRARTAAPLNNSAECSFTLEVRDNDPPRVRECPESFSTRVNQGQSSKPVQWMEPHFSDNVRITSLKKSHEPGAILPLGEHLINYEAKDSSDNKARCSFTVTVLPSATSHQNNFRKPVNTEGVIIPSSTSPKPEVHASLRNVVCYVGKKGRRIVFQSRVIPRGCSEMTVDVVGDAGQGSFNTLNTITQNSAENSATSQISSVSFSNQDHPQQASAFSQSVSNGRNNNRLVHSTSSVTNGAHGTNSRASSYAIAISSSSRNFDLPFLPNNDKQVYEEDFVVPVPVPTQRQPPLPKTRAGQTREGLEYRSNPNLELNSNISSSEPFRKYFRHFDTWDTTTDSYRSRERF